MWLCTILAKFVRSSVVGIKLTVVVRFLLSQRSSFCYQWVNYFRKCNESCSHMNFKMDLGNARMPRIGINALYDAFHPDCGLVWTDGQTVFVIPYDCTSETFDFASSTKLEKFQCVREVHWFKESIERKCLLCIVLDCTVTVWFCEGKLAELRLEQVHRIDIRTIARGCLWNPKVDVLCLLTATQCVFYTNHLRTTATPFTLPLVPRTSVTCGCWSRSGSVLVIGVGATLLVYSWCDIGNSLHNFRVMNCSILGLLGGGRISAVECLSEVQFVCSTELPLDQLCFEYNRDMFVLPDDMNQVEESACSNESDDTVLRPSSKRCSSLHLDQLLQLPRTHKISCADASQLILIEVDPVVQQVKKRSSINIAGLLSPDVLHVCIKSGFVIVGSNTSAVLSLFKVSDDCLKFSSSMKLSLEERLKGLCSLSTKSCDTEETVVMMTGRLSASDQIFPPTSSSAEYHLRLYQFTDFRQQFEAQNIGAIDPTVSCKNGSGNTQDEMAIWSSSSHCYRNKLSDSQLLPNTDRISPSVYQNASSHLTGTKLTADFKSKTALLEKNYNNEDVTSLMGLKLPSLNCIPTQKPFIEVIRDSGKHISDSRKKKDEELETEILDFKAVLPDFAVNLLPHTSSPGDSVHRSGSGHLKTDINFLTSELDLPSRSSSTVQNKNSNSCSARYQDITGLSHSSDSVINSNVSMRSSGAQCTNFLTGQMDNILKQLKLISLKLQIQEKCLAKLQSSVDTLQQVSHISKYQPARKPHVLRVIFKRTLGPDVQKCFVLDNYRLHLNAIKEAFNLVSVELLVDGEPCVLWADVDGFIPLSFNPNESVFITGQPPTDGI